MTDSNISLQEALKVRNAMSDYRDKVYLNMIRQIKEKTNEILKDDLGSQFVYSCGRDLAGEVVRTYFDTSDYNITVDQLATRILKFNYKDEYDPLYSDETIRKNVYNYNDISSSTLDVIKKDLDDSQEQLFEIERKKDSSDTKSRRAYRDSQANEDGVIYDELTGRKGESTTVQKNGKDVLVSDLHADHIQSREAAKYDKKRLTEKGVEELREFIGSSDNMQIMHASANTSKGDIRVCEIDGKIVYKNARSNDYDPSTDITHKATPEQLAEAVCQQWEKDPDSAKAQKLKDKGYLNEDGNVPKSVRKKLEDNIRHSQNQESKIILKNTKYGEVAKEAAGHTAKNIGKIIAGQVIYYAAPPIIFEARCIVQNKDMTIDNAMNKLSAAGKRIGNYVYSHLKDIFKNVASNSLKKFIKSFMDILIGMVKATVKKLLKVVKSLVMAVVDSVRIIATPDTTPAQKADSVFNLFGITVTNIVIELLFEAIEKGANIPEFLLKPLQIVTSVVCTNFTMLILQKADIFDVRLGFKIEAIKKVFAEEKENYQRQMDVAEQFTDLRVEEIINNSKKECMVIYNELLAMDTKKQTVRGELEKINQMFSVDIDFEGAWLKYLGLKIAN